MTPRTEKVLAWAATGASCAYYLWAYSVLSRHGSGFASFFQGLGAKIPASTRFLVENQQWLYPSMFGAAVVFVLAKEIFVRDKRLTLAITLATALCILFLADAIKTVLFFPLLDLMEKLS